MVMLDEPCVVSWSWQTRALRRAAGNCVLYTYTTKYTFSTHRWGMILSGTTAFQGEHWHTGTDTLTQGVGLDCLVY